MKKAKKLLSLFLAVMMLFSGMSVGLGGIAVFAATNVTVDGVVDKSYTSTDDVIICVPETIYMTPSIGASVSGQYFVNNNVDENGKVTLATDRAHTTGQISFYAPGATAFSFNVTAVNGGIGDPVMGGSATDANSSFEVTTWQNTDLGGKTGYLSVDALNLFINGNGLTAGNTALIKWAITLYYGANDTTGVTYYAYSTLYAPYYAPVGAATRVKTYNSKVYLQSAAWVSGVHGIMANPLGGDYWVAATNQSMTNEKEYKDWGRYYAKTADLPMVPLIYGVGTASNTTTAINQWISASASTNTLSSATFRYTNFEAGSSGATYYRDAMANEISDVAYLTVDTSRYNNLNQIPNLTVGYNITDIEGVSGATYWYVSDFTATAHKYTKANNDVANFFHYTKKETSGKLQSNGYADNWFYSTDSQGTILQGSTTAGGTVTTGTEYNTSWNRSIVTGSDYYDYMFKGAARGWRDESTDANAYSSLYVQLRVNNVDKSDLRSLVLKATSLNEQIYTTETWTPFISALQTAAQALGNPTASATDVTNAKNALESAMNALKLQEYNLVFDNLIDFSEWNTTTASNGTINNRTDSGFILTSNDGASEATSLSPFFPVTPGKQYKIDIDITGNAWDVYIFFCDANGNWVDFADGPTNRYSSGASTGIPADNAVFTAPNKGSVVKAQIRVDANGSNNAVTFSNIRVYEVNTVADDVSYVPPKTVTHGSACGELPTPTRPGYDFAGWAYADGTAVTASDKITANTNLYSTWTPATYAITFLDANGATYATDTYTLAETTITLPATNPTKTAYSFAGWVVDTAAGNWTSGESVTAAVSSKYGNITVKPVWTPSNYDITFNTDGGSAVANVSYNIESTFTLPSTTKTAYDFAGWKVQTAVGNWSADTTYQAGSQSEKYGNVTLVAQWNPIAYTITYDANGGSVSETNKTYNYESIVTLPTPTKTGYTFAGWKVTSGTAGSWTAGTYNAGNVSSMYGNVTLQAQWTAIPYTITFVNWDDSVLQNTKFDYGTTPVAPADPTRADDNGYTYAFKGWEPTVSTVTGEATYKATYAATLIPYTITLEAGEGSVSNPSVGYNYESTSVTLPNAEREGYTFTGWTVKETAGSWTAGAPVNGTLSNAWGNVTLVANYTPVQYTVAYDANGGTLTDENDTSFTATYDKQVGRMTESVMRNGYTFTGWNTKADGTGDTITTSTVWQYTDVTTVYAQWDAIEYTITFTTRDITNGKDNIVTAPEAITYTIEDDLSTLLPKMDVDGYDFAYWYNSTASGSWSRNTSYTTAELTTGNWGDVTLMMAYTAKTYTITWVNEDGTVLETDESAYGSIPTYDGATPTKAPDATYQYEFAGWAPEVTTVTGAATYTATYTESARTYTVKFLDYDGTEISNKSYTYGEAIEVPADPTREADAQYTYTFSTWKDADGEDVSTFPTVTADVTYTADYTAVLRSYTITWIVDGVETTATLNYGETPNYGSTPVKDATAEYSYTFTGWDKEIAAVTGDATYTAQFEAVANEYTVTWINGETQATVREDKVAYGSAITDIPAVPAHTQGLPGAWDNIPETMPAENITITSEYVKGSVVTWVVGETEYQKVFAEGTQITYDKTEPTKTATAEYTYTFVGWAEEADGEVIVLPIAGTTPVTYYAVFTSTPVNYTVTWVADGETKYTETVAFGSAIPSKDVPVKTGHTGAWDSVPATMPANNVVITAVYTPIVYTITWVTGTDTYTGSWAYGTTPVPATNNVDTSKASTASTDYAFAGWDNEIVAVTGDATYTAQYTETTRKYTITWVVDGSSTTADVEYGTVPSYGADPVKASDAQYDYTFAGWDKEIVAVTEDATYTADFVATTRSYTITWITGSGEYTGSWAYGSTPDPDVDNVDTSKAPTAEASYTFTGWDKTISSVTGTATYTAQYDETAREYKVTYVVDGVVLEEQTVAFGSNFSHPAIPAKVGYNAHWDVPFMTMPAQDITVTAVYTEMKYMVTWVADGKTVYEEQVAYGSAIPSKTVPAKDGHTGEWDSVPATMPAENVTITAVYSPAKYNVTWTFTTSSGSDIATHGVDCYIQFTNYIPGDVRITVNGDLLATDSYTYNSDSGELKIFGAAIVGNISITERAAEGYQNVTISAVNATLTNTSAIVEEGTAYHTQIVPNAGYLLPETVTICIDGVELYDGYSYDANTGKLTINADVMYGELSIRFECPVDPYYTEGTTTCNCGCHGNAFVRFFWQIINFLRRLFGMNQYQYCGCGAVHW